MMECEGVISGAGAGTLHVSWNSFLDQLTANVTFVSCNDKRVEEDKNE